MFPTASHAEGHGFEPRHELDTFRHKTIAYFKKDENAALWKDM